MTKKYVTAYVVTRHYGGPEEGGWYYDWFSPIETIPVMTNNAKIIQDDLKEIHKEESSQYDRHSVLGGTDLEVIIENKPCEFQSKERPRYE